MKPIWFLALSLTAADARTAEWTLPANAPLLTRWAQEVSPTNALPEYPRPQMVREHWQNLNGLWDFAITGWADAHRPDNWDGKILVPYPIESALSGVMKPLKPDQRLWYRRTFTVPTAWKGKSIRLNCDAIDWESEVFINGTSAGVHRGGYDAFSFDITSLLRGTGAQELVLRVYDPTKTLGIPRGKQTTDPRGFMYTSCTGIWAPVWLEPFDAQGVKDLTIVPDVDRSLVRLTVDTFAPATGLTVTATVRDGAMVVRTVDGTPGAALALELPQPKLWSPDRPFLYDLDVTVKQGTQVLDQVQSYFGMRKISVGVVDGHPRLLLNGKALFQMGPLDQGYWPDGIYTAPTDEALRYDLEQIKAFGFNMVRKHIKVERARWYYWADRLGVMVWQDMPSANSYMGDSKSPPVDAPQFEAELRRMAETHRNSPSIVMWGVFNEGQSQEKTPGGAGQQSTAALVDIVRTLDPSRLINEASGGLHFGVGDILDGHAYPEPSFEKSATQAMACGEFGGIGYKMPGHMWDPKKAWGYKTVSAPADLEAYYEALLNIIWTFKADGMSAAVYTQITDVENECNGLMTYDRVVKPDVARIVATNRKVIDGSIAVIPVVPTSEKTPQIWKYTMDEPPADWFAKDFGDTAWKSGPAGFGARTPWPNKTIWLRREFDPGAITPAEIESLILMVRHDEDVWVYINGVLAASSPTCTVAYVPMKISDEAKRAIIPNGRNVLAVHCIDHSGGRFIDASLAKTVVIGGPLYAR